MRRLLLGLVLAALVAVPTAEAQVRNHRQAVMAITEVATGTPVTVTVYNLSLHQGYLVVKTENETETASLVVTLLGGNRLGDFLLCTMPAITTETTTVNLFGSGRAQSAGLASVCDFGMPRVVKVVFTTTGVGADFDVTADIEWAVTEAR